MNWVDIIRILVLLLISKNGKTKKISILEIKRFVDDIESGKINNKKTAIYRYLKYIYEDKIFLDSRNVIEKNK